MANELKHKTVGVELTQTEFEAIGLHVLDSQATGDLIYASSATQLSRLGIGTEGQTLQVVSGALAWADVPDVMTVVATDQAVSTENSVWTDLSSETISATATKVSAVVHNGTGEMKVFYNAVEKLHVTDNNTSSSWTGNGLGSSAILKTQYNSDALVKFSSSLHDLDTS